MHHNDLFEKETDRRFSNMEKRLKRIQRDFWYLKETQSRSQKAVKLGHKSQQLDLFVG